MEVGMEQPEMGTEEELVPIIPYAMPPTDAEVAIPTTLVSNGDNV